MRLGLFALLALAAGAFAAHFLLADRGYVLINFRGFVIEMSVPGLVLMLVALYLVVRFAVALRRLPRTLGERLAERRARLSGERLGAALLKLAEGDFGRGERLLTSGVRRSATPVVNYLLAARAAQLQGATARRDEWLELARQESPDAEVAVLLTRAELALEADDAAGALRALDAVDALRPRQAAALGLRARALQRRADAPALVALLPELERAQLSTKEREQAAVMALRAALDVPNLTSAGFEETWARVPGKLRAGPELLALRAAALARVGRSDDAERELRTALRKHWHPALVDAYGELRGAEPAKLLHQAETWLATHPEDPILLLAAARLAMAAEDWGKARSYLESSLALAPAPRAFAVYGRLLARLGEADAASAAFQTGLRLVAGVARDERAERPALAAPEAPTGIAVPAPLSSVAAVADWQAAADQPAAAGVTQAVTVGAAPSVADTERPAA